MTCFNSSWWLGEGPFLKLWRSGYRLSFASASSDFPGCDTAGAGSTWKLVQLLALFPHLPKMGSSRIRRHCNMWCFRKLLTLSIGVSAGWSSDSECSFPNGSGLPGNTLRILVCSKYSFPVGCCTGFRSWCLSGQANLENYFPETQSELFPAWLTHTHQVSPCLEACSTWEIFSFKFRDHLPLTLY